MAESSALIWARPVVPMEARSSLPTNREHAREKGKPYVISVLLLTDISPTNRRLAGLRSEPNVLPRWQQLEETAPKWLCRASSTSPFPFVSCSATSSLHGSTPTQASPMSSNRRQDLEPNLSLSLARSCQDLNVLLLAMPQVLRHQRRHQSACCRKWRAAAASSAHRGRRRCYKVSYVSLFVLRSGRVGFVWWKPKEPVNLKLNPKLISGPRKAHSKQIFVSSFTFGLVSITYLILLYSSDYGTWFEIVS